eukprot:480469_1
MAIITMLSIQHMPDTNISSNYFFDINIVKTYDSESKYNKTYIIDTSNKNQLPHITIKDLQLTIQVTKKNVNTTGINGMAHVIADKKNKLLFCRIPKTSSTMFRLLFHLLHSPKELNQWRNNYYNPKHINRGLGRKLKHLDSFLYIKHNESNHQNTLIKYLKIINDHQWRKIVVIRDPLERLLSGYLDKQKNLHHVMTFYEWVNKIFIYNHNKWETDQKRLTNGYHAKYNRTFSNHFSPQYSYCNLNKVYRKYYRETIYFHRSTIGKDAEMLLKSIKNVNISWFYHWGKNRNQTLFDGCYSRVTSKIVNDRNYSQVADFYRQYYCNQSFAYMVIKLFERDYKLFDIPYPQWIQYL